MLWAQEGCEDIVRMPLSNYGMNIEFDVFPCLVGYNALPDSVARALT